MVVIVVIVVITIVVVDVIALFVMNKYFCLYRKTKWN